VESQDKLVTKAIAGHLEMVAPHAMDALGLSNPYVAMASTGLKTISEIES
jgi:hypothetical protein